MASEPTLDSRPTAVSSPERQRRVGTRPATGHAGSEWVTSGGAVANVAGIILAGNQPWGACLLEEILPRVLTPVVNRPLISYMLRWLRESGIQAASICCNTHTRTLRKSLDNGEADSSVPPDMMIDFYEDIAPRGPAGCIRDAALHSPCDTFVVVDGTIIPQIDIVDLLQSHHRSGASLTVVVASDVAKVGARGEALCPVGIYVFSKRTLEHVPPTGYQDIKETLIPRLYQHGESVVTFRADGAVPRINGVDSYLAVNDWVLTLMLDQPGEFAGYREKGDARIHLSATVDSTVRLVGPIVVGVGSSIGRGVTIVGPTTIGAHCSVGEGAIVCRTSMWDKCSVESGAVLDRCILTEHSQVRAESAYRYVVFTRRRRRFPQVRRLVDRWMGTNGRKQ